MAVSFLIPAALASLAGCDRDVRLAGHKLRDVAVKTVEHYGTTLDQSAMPQQVAYVLLRAVRDDFLATKDAERDAALDIQFDVCAADQIQARNDYGLTRAEAIYNVVYRWAPTVSNYVHDFDMDWEQAQNRLVQLTPRPTAEGRPEERHVALEVTAPDGDPNANALLVIGLIQDNGYWRVLSLGFSPKQRTMTARRINKTAPSTESTSQADR